MFVTVFALLAIGWLYVRGTRALWQVAGHGHGIRTWQCAAFIVGLLAVALALVSPLDSVADALFSAHMAQHLLLIVVAAPSLALGSVNAALPWAFSRGARHALGTFRHRVHHAQILTRLPVAFALHSLSVWLWHAPPLYESALRSTPVHMLEHATLLGTGFLFWSAAFNGLVRGRRTLGASVLYVFALGAQCTGLGALITLSNRPWYAAYATRQAGLSALDDQVLAGALMWVPAGMLYLGFALLVMGMWLRPISPAGPGPALQRPGRRPAVARLRRTTGAE